MSAEVERVRRVRPPTPGSLVGLDLRMIPAVSARRVEHRWRLSEALHLRPRQSLFLVVLALHAGVLALVLMTRTREHLAISLPAIEAQVIADAPAHTESPPLPPLALERPHIDLITPEVPITESAPDAPTASPPSPPAAAPATKGAPSPPEPVTPPRFDAAYLNNPAPAYPMASRRMHEKGMVLLRVRVSQQGTALDVLIERTSGSQHLDVAALEAVRHWRFVPAHRGTESVEAWVLVPLEFALHR
ncbi:MAG TPA: energy transducer TonB [Steroidobacteraceae bacterium]